MQQSVKIYVGYKVKKPHYEKKKSDFRGGVRKNSQQGPLQRKPKIDPFDRLPEIFIPDVQVQLFSFASPNFQGL